MILEADGFAVVGEAEDGEGALTAIEELRPDLVLLDIQLPDMDGFAVLEQLGSNAPPSCSCRAGTPVTTTA